MKNYASNASRRRNRNSEPKQPVRPRLTPKPLEKPLDGAFGTLIPAVQQAIAVEGYVTPTPIQEECIPPLL